jgi:hypothetical protein
MNYQHLAHKTGWRRGQAAGWSLLLSAATLLGQTQVDLRTQSKRVDFKQATSTAPVKSGTTAPATCAVGELFYNTSVTAGRNLYGCTTASTWTLLGDGGTVGGGGGGILIQKTGTGDPNGTQPCVAPSTTDRTIYFDTAALETWECVSANAWNRIIDTPGTGSVIMNGSFNATDLGMPVGIGMAALQFGDQGLEYFPNGGSLSRTVVPNNCAVTSGGGVLSSVGNDGFIACRTPTVDSQTGKTGSVTIGNLLAAAPAGLYRVNVYAHTTTPEGSACTLDVDISYTYNGSPKTVNLISGHNLNVDETATSGTRLIQVDNSANIQRSLTGSCTRTAYIFDYTIALERVN